MTEPEINWRNQKSKSTSIEGSSKPVQSSSGLKDTDEPKKTRPRFTFEEKKKILQESNVQTTEYICDKYKIHYKTLTKWKAKREEIYEAALDSSTLTKKKLINVPEELDNTLYLWLLNSVSNRTRITEPMIQRKALVLNAQLVESTSIEGSSEPVQSSSGLKDQNSDEPEKKRPRFTFDEKKKILQESNVRTTEYICDKYKIHYKTLAKWKAKREQIYEAALDSSTLAKKKIINVPEELDNALYLWLLNSVSNRKPITGPMIQRKGLVLNTKLGESTSIEDSSEPVQSSSGLKDQNTDEPKKTRPRFTFEEKKKILQESNVQTTEYICDKYKIHSTTLGKWKAKRKQIHAAALDSSTLTKKRIINVSEELDNALYSWLLNSISSGTQITGPIIQKKALVLNAELGGNPDFKASNGWFEKWKLRKNVRNKMIIGEKLSCDPIASVGFKETLKKNICNKTAIQVANPGASSEN